MLRVLLMLAVLGRVEAAPPPDDPEAGGAVTAASLRRSDPNYSRLMFAPTGRPLRKGDGYFSSYELLFPGFAVGLTDNISLAGGVSVIPSLGLTDQLLYVSPKVGFQISDRAALSLGALVAGSGAADLTVGVGFVVGTFGSPDASLTAGVGAAREPGDRFAETNAIVMLGGQVRLSDSVALVSENWIVLADDIQLSEQPFGLALRFFGERLSADVGLVLVGDVLDEGFPVPWLSVSYHFGRDRPSRSPARAAPMLRGAAGLTPRGGRP
jgi:hypothetical protein